MTLIRRTIGIAFLAGVTVALPFTTVTSSQQPARRYIAPGGPGTDAPNQAYSRGLRMGDTLYIAGNTGTRGTTGDLDADLETEIRSLLDATKQMLEDEGMTMDDLVQVQVFCTDLALYGAFNDIYRTYFTGPLPTRMFIGADTLLGGAYFETMAIAVKDS